MLDIQLRVNALGKHIIGDGEQIHVSGTLPVSEQSPFHPLGSGKKGQLGACHTGSPVIMGMDTEYNSLPVLEMTIHPLDLIRIHIRRVHFHGGRQVYNNRFFLRRSPGLLYRRTDFQGEIQFGSRKTLRGIFQHDLSRKSRRTLLYHLGTLDRNSNDLFPGCMEHHIPLQGGCGIINMYHGLLTAFYRFKRPVNQFFPALGQHLNPHIIGNHFPIHQLSEKVKFNLACRRKSDFYFLEPKLHQILEHFYLFFHNHGIDQSLVSVPQIHTAPYRRFLYFPVGPFPYRISNHRIFTVSFIIQHNLPPCFFLHPMA